MYKVIACSIFKPYIESLSLHSDSYDFVYLEIKQHNHPNTLVKNIQKEIDNSRGYTNIIVLYGLCGGALLKIQVRDIPLIVVKVHDCMSIMLGSKKRYQDLTKINKSITWTCYSLQLENDTNSNIEEWQQLYDEEMVAYLTSILVPTPTLYISFNLQEEKNIEEKEIIAGDIQFLKDILNGTSKELLTLHPGEKLKQSDDDTVIEKERIWKS